VKQPDLNSRLAFARELGKLLINRPAMFEGLDAAGLVAKVEELGKQKHTNRLSSRELPGLIRKVIDKNEGKVSEYKSGKSGVIESLIGDVMRESKGKARPEEARELLERILGSNRAGAKRDDGAN